MKKVLIHCFFLSSFIQVSAQERNCCTKTASSEDGSFSMSITRCSSGEQQSGDSEEYIANCLQAEQDVEKALVAVMGKEG